MHRILLVFLIRSGLLLPILLVGMSVGCALSPRVEFLQVTCDRVQRGGDLQAVSFGSSIKAHGLAGQQVIYRVDLVDSRLRPLRSANDRFRNAAGNVAASKSLFVHESPSTFEDVRVTIPVVELEIHTRDRPVLAEFRVCLPNGECLAQETAVVPVYRATHARQPAPRLEPEPRVAARTQRPQTPADRQRPASSQPVARRKTAPCAAAQRSPTSRTVSRLTTRPAPSPTADNTPGFPDLWRAAMGVAGTWVVNAARPLLRSDHELAATEADQLAGEVPPKATSGPTSRPAPRVLVAEVATVPTTAPAREPPPRSDRYAVQSGDTLWYIAERLLGDSSRWYEIYELNQDKLASPHHLRVGLELRIPSDDEEPDKKSGER